MECLKLDQICTTIAQINIAGKREIHMNKTVDQKEVKGNTNEMYSMGLAGR